VRFLHRILRHLPRKIQIALSGCKNIWLLGSIHDVDELLSVIQDGDGADFRMVVGGGLDPLPGGSTAF